MFRHLPNAENLAMINRWTDEGKMSSKEISQALEVQEDAVKRFMAERKKATAKPEPDKKEPDKKEPDKKEPDKKEPDKKEQKGGDK